MLIYTLMWVEIVSLADDHQASLITVTKAWLYNDHHIPGVVLEEFTVCRQNKKRKYPSEGAVTLVREGINHLDSVQLRTVTERISLPEAEK